MRIAMIISTPFPPEEGIGFYVYNLSKKLIENGHEITVITRGRYKKEDFNFDGIKVIKLPFFHIYPFHIVIHGLFLNKFLNRNRDSYDLLNVHTPLTPIPSVDLPLLSTIHGSLIGNAKEIQMEDFRSLLIKILVKFVSYPLLKKLLKQSDKVVSVSKPVSSEINEFYGYDDVRILYNGVNEKKFFPKKLTENYILYVGRLSYGKGIFDLLKSFEILNDKNLSLIIAGEGVLKKKIETFIISKKMEDRIILKGHVDNNELVKLYQKALIFVFPSHYEGFPTVVLEAMASGLPVLLSDIPAHKNIIKDRIDGILFKKGNFHDLAEKIKILKTNNILIMNLGQNARKTVLEKYTWDKLTNDYILLFKKLVEDRNENSCDLPQV